VGAALELLNEILNTYGKIPIVWGTTEEFVAKMETLIHILVPLCLEKGVRTSNKAVAITCLAQISNISPLNFIQYFSKNSMQISEYFSTLSSNSDPLIRGNGYLCIGSFFIFL